MMRRQINTTVVAFNKNYSIALAIKSYKLIFYHYNRTHRLLYSLYEINVNSRRLVVKTVLLWLTQTIVSQSNEYEIAF